MKPLPVLEIALALCLITKASAEVLQAVTSSAKLFSPVYEIAGIYDGDDSIYLFGGYGGVVDGFRKEISRYSISNDSINLVGSLLFGTYYGSVAKDTDGSFHYVGGVGIRDTATQAFNPRDGSIRLAGEVNIRRYGLIQTADDRTALIYGGVVGEIRSNHIHQWSMETMSLSRIGVLSSDVDGDAALTFLFRGNKIYFMHNYGTTGIKIHVHDLASNTTETLTDVIPDFSYIGINGAFDGTYAYLFGNMGSQANYTCVRYDVASHTAEVVKIVDYPGSSTEGLYRTEPIYVPKLNRIYLFGGYTNDKHYDGIWYIELSPATDTEATTTTIGEEATTSLTSESETPSTTTITAITSTTEGKTTSLPPQAFNCSHRPDGFYPHTEDCSHYFGCKEGQSTELKCPEPLLYNAESRGCVFPSQMDCDLTCEGKEDGFYSHPYYCAYYVGCLVGEKYIFECDPPFLFDPAINNCNYPDLVECLNDYRG